jgi:hypothetical protein
MRGSNNSKQRLGVALLLMACFFPLAHARAPALLHQERLTGLYGLAISETEINLGTIAPTQAVSHTVAIKNESRKDIGIGYSRISCGCLSVKLPKQSIGPGELIEITLELDPEGYAGNVRQTAELRFYNVEAEESFVVFTLIANIQSPIRLS